MTDLEAELAELLPCLELAELACSPDDIDKCDFCEARPAVLAFILRKLDEARADSELLDGAWKLLPRAGDQLHLTRITTAEGVPLCAARHATFNGPMVERLMSATTLREALRKLVGGGE